MNNSDFILQRSSNYIPNENTYIENTLRLNKGKKVCIHQTFPNTNAESTFIGIIEECGKDHIILSDPNTGNWYLLLIIYLTYIDFEEEVKTSKQFYSSSTKNY